MAFNQYSAYPAYGAMLPQQLEAADALGGAETIVKPPTQGRKRMKMNIFAIFVSLFLPWLLFTLLFADVSFQLHYKQPVLSWCIVALGALAALAFGGLTVRNISHLYQGSSQYQPSWFIFLFLTSLIAIVLGPVLGSRNFWQNMQPYYNLKNLNEYASVDPTRMRGEQMMDAGRVDFLEGAMVDLRRAYAFQNLDTYCVAPITMYNPALGSATPLSSYDFWAVGLNCCSGDSASAVDFKCSKGSKAHQGLRLVNGDQRTYFRLAVQQAEAAHMIKSAHPLFFYWAEDASLEMENYLKDAFKMFASWMCGLFLAQLCLVLILSYVLSKTGHNNL